MFHGRSVGAPLFDEKGAPTEVNLTGSILKRYLLFELNEKRRKGAYLLFRKEGVSFVVEEVSNDISFFVF